MRIDENKIRKLVTIKQDATLYPAFSESAFRWLVFHAEENGFNTCISRIGRKIILDLCKFESWIEMQGQQRGIK